MIEEKLMELGKMNIKKTDLVEKLMELGFTSFYDNSESKLWDCTYVGKDTCIMIKNNIVNEAFVQLDYYCEATNRRECLSSTEIVEQIINKINWLAEEKYNRIRLIKEFYKKVLNETYQEKLKLDNIKNITIDEKLELINSTFATEKVDKEFLKKLKKAGIDGFVETKYDDNTTNYTFFTEEQWKNGEAVKYSDDGYFVYEKNENGEIITGIYECIYYLGDLYDIK